MKKKTVIFHKLPTKVYNYTVVNKREVVSKIHLKYEIDRNELEHFTAGLSWPIFTEFKR